MELTVKTGDRRVRFQPDTFFAMKRGIQKITDAIRPTLGPVPRLVAMQRASSAEAPELLDNGGVIARRLIQIQDPDEDMGAMFMRQMLWSQHQKTGDGTATAAVIFQAIFDRGGQYLAAGGNAMRLREFLEKGLELILRELSRMSVHLEGKEDLARLAETICYDPQLAKLLGEIMDIAGPYGLVDVRTNRARGLDREYVEGMYWAGGFFSRTMTGDDNQPRIELNDAAILISNLEVDEPQQLIPVLRVAVQENIQALVIMARKMTDAAIGMVLAANKNKTGLRVFAVKTPEFTSHAVAAAMDDLAILTGGRPLIKEAGDSLIRVEAGDLGKARQVWADKDFFGIVGGKGDPRLLRKHLAGLRTRYSATKESDERGKIQERIGKLLGGSATLWIGGSTKSELETRKEAAERTTRAMRGALIDGVLPGGGAALLACCQAIQDRLDRTEDLDERAAYTILLKGLESPVRVLAANAGCDPGYVLAELSRAGPGFTFDVRRQAVVAVEQAGLYDSAGTIREAIYSAVKSAALALSVDVLIHHKKPAVSTEP